ncbi:MAG: xanthine dehydrogenase accessory protein XdhC [Nocardioides sp.]
MSDLHWLATASLLRHQRRAGVLVTLSDVRGHAPRAAGTKMVVAAEETFGRIGGGNLEETAIARARALLDAGAREPESLLVSLSDRAHAEHGRQCCGGEVTVLLEPLAVVPSVAIFGLGHVGLELARVLARHDVELHLADSRAAYVDPRVLAVLDGGPATIHTHHAPVPEVVLGEVPRGTHVLVMTHDHAEDFALCDAALRSGHLASVGLIGSAAKWRRFEKGLRLEGQPDEAIARIRCPIGAGGPAGKEPATIALGVAAELLAAFRAEVARTRGRSSGPGPSTPPTTRTPAEHCAATTTSPSWWRTG